MSAFDVCKAIHVAAAARPQLRIGQLIENAVAVAAGPGASGDEVFYFTDEELARALRRYAEQAKEQK